MSNKNDISKGWINTAIALVSLGILLVFFPWSCLNGVHIYKNFHFDTKEYDKLGGFVLGISTPFLSLATIILLWRTYTLQNMQIDEQRAVISKQRFEDIFFKLLDTHNSIVQAIDLRKENDKTQIIAVQRDCFRLMYDRLKEDCKNQDCSIDNTVKIYGEVQNKFKADLHHYFRFVYRILKFIKEADNLEPDEKYEFAAIFRAVFSPYELIFIFYNGLHEFGKDKLKPLLEEYSFFKNIDDTLFINVADHNSYELVAFGGNNGNERRALLEKWKEKHVKMKKEKKELEKKKKLEETAL